jgi:hypothetical protein
MQIICTTEAAASQVLFLLMVANLWQRDDFSIALKDILSPPFVIDLHRPLDATLRAQIEQIPDTLIID